MKHLVHVTLVTALVLSASAWAQDQPTPPATTTPTIKLPEPSQPSGATSEPTTSKTATAAPSTPRPKRHVKRARRYAREYPYYEENYYRRDYYRGGGSPDDYMADEYLADGTGVEHHTNIPTPLMRLTRRTRHHGHIIRGVIDRDLGAALKKNGPTPLREGPS
jgi:hypothetical protein